MRNLRNIRTFLCGMLATALLVGLVGPAVAASHVNKQLYYNDIKVRLNGKVLDLKDANGKKVEPFIIDGTTYLPVRAVGEALGLNVSWDGSTSTVILGNDPEKGQPAAWLGDLEPFSGTATEKKVERDGQYDKYFTANDGSTYDRYWEPSLDSSKTGVSFLLKGQYTRFTTTLYISQYYKNSATQSVRQSLQRIQIFLDDKLAYTSDPVGDGIEPVEINLPLNRAYKMEIVTQSKKGDSAEWASNYNSYFYFSAFLGNAALWTN